MAETRRPKDEKLDFWTGNEHLITKIVTALNCKSIHSQKHSALIEIKSTSINSTCFISEAPHIGSDSEKAQIIPTRDTKKPQQIDVVSYEATQGRDQ